MAHALQVLGAELGPRLMPPAPDNPEGFFENLDVVEINDDLLDGLGHAWDDFRPLPEGWLSSDAAQHARKHIAELYARTFAQPAFWAIKDPRLCLTFPLWRETFEACGATFGALLVVRDPAAVARSLYQRNGIGTALGHALWASYTRAALDAVQGMAHAVLSIHAFNRDPQRLAGALQALGCDCSARGPGARDAGRRALEHLCRTDDSSMDAPGTDTGGFDSASMDWRGNDMDAAGLRTLAATVAEHADADELAMSCSAYWVNQRSQYAHNLRDLEQKWLALQSQHADAVGWAQGLQEQLEDTRQRLQALQDEHEKVAAWGKGLDDELGAARERIGALQGQLADRDTLIESQRADLTHQRQLLECVAGESAAARQHLERVLRSRSWAITRPLRVVGRILRGEWYVVRAGLKHHREQTYVAVPMHSARYSVPQPVADDAHKASGISGVDATNHIAHGEVKAAPRLGLVDSAGHTQNMRSTLREHFGAFVERCYRAMPVSGKRKRELKGWFFRLTGPLFASTAPYRRWQAYQRMHEQDAAYMPVGAAASAQLEAVPRSAAPMPQELWRADGTREWLDYQTVRARIDGIRQRQREDKNPTPYPMISIEVRQCAEAAAKIKLPKAYAQPDVTILIPVFNHLSTTLECLASIAAHSNVGGLTFEVLIANDGSTDATAQLLATIPNLRLVNQPENLGFLRNCNAAVAYANGRLLVLLNNDVQVTAGWLGTLVDCLESGPDIGAVGPRVVYPSGWLQEAGTRLLRDGGAELVGLNDLPDLPRYRYSRDVDYCSGACLLLRTADFERLQGFDERYAPAYCEDSDLCMRLRAEGKRIVYCAGATVVHRLSTTSDSIPGDYKLRCIARNLTTFAGRWQADLDRLDSVRTIAFYLPQFHPIAENDRWWGPGFTEWTNVAKARPNFVGHDQPRLPADLGYYDLRLPEVMEQQAALAKRYGLGGFCYYYYWFAGQRLLERPLEAMLTNPRMQFPFCLCWANENWTRRWDGNEQDVLMAQQHSDADDEAVIRDLLRYFRSPNYIRIGGRPLIAVYRVGLFPDFRRTAALWRQVCRDAGIGDPYIAQVESFEMVSAGIRPQDVGCDAAIEFPPHGMADPYPLSAPLLNPEFHGAVADYRDLAVRCATRELPAYKRFLGVATGWDNTARRQNNSYCFEHATPGAFQAWLETAIECTKQQFSGDERLVFINAWNEWAEGAYLEPDQRFGHAYLQAHANACEAAHLMRYDRYSLG